MIEVVLWLGYLSWRHLAVWAAVVRLYFNIMLIASSVLRLWRHYYLGPKAIPSIVQSIRNFVHLALYL